MGDEDGGRRGGSGGGEFLAALLAQFVGGGLGGAGPEPYDGDRALPEAVLGGDAEDGALLHGMAASATGRSPGRGAVRPSWAARTPRPLFRADVGAFHAYGASRARRPRSARRTTALRRNTCTRNSD
ncbi:hypothetical protein GCM10018987_48310 [Streptomyces cremeus]